MSRETQDGLAWENTVFDTRPIWTREPSIEAIQKTCRQHLGIGIGTEARCDVSFFAAGAFNKLYLIELADQSVLMRISLPVYPVFKTRGEVTTLRWVLERTQIPVPRVLSYDDNSSNNDIGFEWILMERMPGVPAHRKWRTMTMEQKVAVTIRLAELQAQLFQPESHDSVFSTIGTLQPNPSEPGGAAPGRLVSHEFFMGEHINYDVPRGPFGSCRDWLSAELRMIELEQTAAMNEADDDSDKEDADEILLLTLRLRALLPRVFHDQDSTETTVLYHGDLNLHNILLDDHGNIMGIVDWECVSTLPLWKTAVPPKYLMEQAREEKPDRANYADKDDDHENGAAATADPDELDDEGKNELYWIHLAEYEATQLRKIYEERLKHLWPGWPWKDSLTKVEFYDAVTQCSAGWFLRAVREWIDKEEGRINSQCVLPG